MVDFRRCITGLAMLALFAGLAAAQVGVTQGQLTCGTQVAVTPQLRGEGFTEMTGDITISCTGGTQGAQGSNIPLVNIAVFYNTNVTSRLIGATTNSFLPNEALLLIDEPGAALAGEGPARAQKLCTTPLTGCTATVGTLANVAPGAVVGSTSPAAVGPDGLFAPNVYQGTSSSTTGNVVTFFGVPVFPPTSTNSRVYRITNVRVNANALVGSAAFGAGTQIAATITVSGSASLGIPPGVINVGLVNPGLAASTGTAGTVNQCQAVTLTSASTISFTENFGTAFKTRVNALSTPTPTAAFAGQSGTTTQNVPGGIFNSESNFVFPIGTAFAGLADYGTRLKATFSNIPPNTRLFVSTTNVLNNATPVLTPFGGGPIGGSGGNVNPGAGTAYVGFAQLVNGEASPDGTISGFFPALPSTTVSGTVPIVEITNGTATATAVWEVLNTDPNTAETLKFAVFVTSGANNLPAGTAGSPSVTLSFAPTATSAVASSTLTIPRFTSGAVTGNVFSVNICRTVLLYPYVTNQAGFDTGITVANTSLDTGVFSTVPQSGTCTFNGFGQNLTTGAVNAPVVFTSATIPAGGEFIQGLSAMTGFAGFQGYIIAACNFQFAHGFAFINNPSQLNNVAMGYLAIVLTDVGAANPRTPVPTSGSEIGAH